MSKEFVDIIDERNQIRDLERNPAWRRIEPPTIKPQKGEALDDEIVSYQIESTAATIFSFRNFWFVHFHTHDNVPKRAMGYPKLRSALEALRVGLRSFAPAEPIVVKALQEATDLFADFEKSSSDKPG